MRFLALMFILAVLALGYVVVFLRLRRWQASRQLIETYRKKFQDFCEDYHDSFDQQHYECLMKNVLRVQATTDQLLDASDYEDYLQRGYGRSGRALVDILEQMSQTSVHEQRLSAARNLLTRCVGMASEEAEKAGRSRLDPMCLFREGIRFLLLVPALLGRWATGRSRLERLVGPDDQRTIRWVSTCSVLGLFFPLCILFVGWAPIEDGATFLFREGAVALSDAMDWVADLLSAELSVASQ